MNYNHLLKQSKLAFLFILCASFSAKLFGQNKSIVSDVFFSGGTILMDNLRFNKAELILLAPNSQLLNANLDKYRPSSSIYGYSGTQGATSFSAQIGINPFKSAVKKSVSPLLRIGITMGQVNQVNEYLSYADRFPYDTLISQRTGEKIFLDSVAGSQMNINQSGNQIRFNIALIYQTDLERRISVYSGVEVGAGLTFNNTTQITKSEFHQGTHFNSFFYGGHSNFQWENFTNKNGYLAQASIPIGFNLRLSKQKPLLNQALLYLEFSPGLAYYHIPEVKSLANFTYQTNVGLRFRI
jgi:hypothetical protein